MYIRRAVCYYTIQKKYLFILVFFLIVVGSNQKAIIHLIFLISNNKNITNDNNTQPHQTDFLWQNEKYISKFKSFFLSFLFFKEDLQS